MSAPDLIIRARRLLAAALPGPWGLEDDRVLVAQVTFAEFMATTTADSFDDGLVFTSFDRPEDAALVHFLVNNAPALLDELERLRAENAALRVLLDVSRARLEAAEAVCEALRGEVGDGRFGNKLKVLARWFDADDAAKGRNGTEVQRDLRTAGALLDRYAALRDGGQP